MTASNDACQTHSVAGTLDELELVDEASFAAARAAQKAEVRITELTSLDDLAVAANLYDSVWSSDNGSQMTSGLLRALSYSKNYVAGAFSGRQMVGAVTGFRAGGAGDPHLHSHILGVLPASRSRNVGYALKHHQRAWALEQGLNSVMWTFDPLVAKNAYFNLTKLGANAGDYLTNFYGEMNDAQNVGEESDRLVVEWRLRSEKALAAAREEFSEPDIETLKSSGASVVLDVKPDGHPLVTEPSGTTLLLRVPSDIVGIRLADPRLGRNWRMAVRETLGDLLNGHKDRRYKIKGTSRSGWFVLSES